MTKQAEEAARLVDDLPADKAQAVLEYARYLADKADAEAWRQKLDDPRFRTNLSKAAEEALAEFRAGATEPLDPERI